MRQMTFLIAALGLLFTSQTAWAHERSTRLPQKGLVFRLDLSAVGTWTEEQTSFSVDSMNGDPEQLSFKSTGIAVGPKLLLNLGYAPSRLVRIGVYGAAEGAPQIAVDESIPYASIAGHFRLSAGPTVGFRFGPDAPLELEFGVGLVRQSTLGSQAVVLADDNRYPLGSDKWGGEAQAKLLFRPGGAGDTFALHVGGLFGLTATTASNTDTKAWLGGLELGVSIGY
jgi:hypothetical protein